MTAVKLTVNEESLIVAIVHSEFNDDCDPNASTWSNVVLTTASLKATFGHLMSKQLVWSQGKGKEATIGLTAAGVTEYIRIKG